MATCAGQGLNHAIVAVVVVCLLLTKLVQGGWSDLDKTFGGGRWQCQEHLSLELAWWVKKRPNKGREVHIS